MVIDIHPSHLHDQELSQIFLLAVQPQTLNLAGLTRRLSQTSATFVRISVLRDVLHITNKLLSRGYPPSIALLKCNFILKCIHRFQSTRQDTRVQAEAGVQSSRQQPLPQAPGLVVVTCESFKSCTPPDEQLPVPSPSPPPSPLSAALLLADG